MAEKKRKIQSPPLGGCDAPTTVEIAFCQILLKQPKRNISAAGAVLGMNAQQASKLSQSKRVQQYMVAYQTQYIQSLAQVEVERVVKLDITREKVAKRYWELANLRPEDTKNNIMGQVEALAGVCRVMSFVILDDKDPLKGKTPEQIRNMALYGSWDAPTAQ